MNHLQPHEIASLISPETMQSVLTAVLAARGIDRSPPVRELHEDEIDELWSLNNEANE